MAINFVAADGMEGRGQERWGPCIDPPLLEDRTEALGGDNEGVVGAALGAMKAVFNWGWGGSIFRLTGTGPIDAFLPVLMFSLLLGLSMDYEVYLSSRIR